ncbi:MAG TPA: T9SS type A sorting domain-containing protein, partial [Melioribacteraceae bacterium]|nr:T9SS type A sorting domain-containing protein [Melioribacteraceae bacterium]
DLFVGWNGTELYVATQSAPSLGKDVFVFLTDSLVNLRNAPWAKLGKVLSWDAFLANESTNNYSGWTDNIGNTSKASGNYLEGTINIQQQFGYIPAYLYLAVGNYNTNDAGALLNQVPLGNGNTDIEANEFAKFDYSLVNLEETITGNYEFSLEQNYPNPFNPATKINYSIPANLGNVKTNLEVYDILGNKVAVLVNQNQSPGLYTVEFNASKFSSGVYFYKLTYGEYSITKKMSLVK